MQAFNPWDTQPAGLSITCRRRPASRAAARSRSIPPSSDAPSATSTSRPPSKSWAARSFTKPSTFERSLRSGTITEMLVIGAPTVTSLRPGAQSGGPGPLDPSGGVPQRHHARHPRLAEERDPALARTVLALVRSAAAHVEQRDAARAETPHRVPEHRLVRAQDLVAPPARAAPEVGELVEHGKDRRGDPVPLRAARAHQQEVAARLEAADELADPLHAVGRAQRLLGEDVLELGVVLVGELDAVRLLHRDALSLALAHRAPAGARHAREDLVLPAREVDLVGVELGQARAQAGQLVEPGAAV